MVAAIAAPNPEDFSEPGEPVSLLYRGAAARASATEALADLLDAERVTLVEAPLGDIWLRDTGPVFTLGDAGLGAAAFAFNGWGGKYMLPRDDEIAELIANRAGLKARRFDLVLEGGAIDTDGEGTIVTTRACLLNRNRNPGMSEADVEAALRKAFGTQKVIWLDDGLMNDHTDGHIDNIVRYIAPGKVVCMRPFGEDDPNAGLYGDIMRTLEAETDAAGRRLEIVDIPSPGLIAGADGAPVPASHVNFYIANASVAMPVYAETDAQHDAAGAAAEILAAHIDRPHFHALTASHLLTGGGSFHCITQQQPAAEEG